MSQESDEEYTMESKQHLWRIGVGRRKSTPKRHYVEDADEVVPESIKRLCYEDEEEKQIECQGCEQKQGEVSQLKREVAQLLRLTEYQQDEIDKLKKDLLLTRRRNDELQRRVLDRMDHLAVVVTNPTPPEAASPPMESPRPSSPSSQHLNVQLNALSPSATSTPMSSSQIEKVKVNQDDYVTRLGIDSDLIERLLETKDAKTISQFTKDVAVTMFGRETLACHSLKGQMCTAHHKNMLDVKPALPADKVEALFDFVVSVFPSTERKVIKSSLREKMNDESKLMKKRLQREMGESASQVMSYSRR